MILSSITNLYSHLSKFNVTLLSKVFFYGGVLVNGELTSDLADAILNFFFKLLIFPSH